MSEFIKNSEKRVESLLELSLGIMNNEDGYTLVHKHKNALENITPYDMIAMEDRQLLMGIKTRKIKGYIEKLMNVIYSYLKKYQWEKPKEGHCLYYLMLENRELEKILHSTKLALREKNYKKITTSIKKLPEFNKHFLRKENILFPYLEKNWDNYRPLQVMWSLHDDIRKKQKELLELIEKSDDFNQSIFTAIGELFFLMYGMITKEELIIFPIAMETIGEKDWDDMHRQSFAIGFSYIETPQKSNKAKPNKKKIQAISSFFTTKTGNLDEKQIEQIFDTLPLDITFIDRNDEVKYFNNPTGRFFERSPAIIGRKVQNCHPPESVHIVEKILKAFREGKRDKAEFRIKMRGKFISIQYFAVRDDQGYYQGVLEVSQDITTVIKQTDEKRLLDWD